MSFYTPRMSTILRFIFRFLCRFHFHLILIGFTHSFTRRSPSVPMFIRSFVRGNLVFSFLLIHFWLLDSCAVLHNAARYLRNITFISAHLSGLSSLIVSRVHSSVRSSPHFHSSFWGSLCSQPPTYSSGVPIFSLRLKTPRLGLFSFLFPGLLFRFRNFGIHLFCGYTLFLFHIRMLVLRHEYFSFSQFLHFRGDFTVMTPPTPTLK